LDNFNIICSDGGLQGGFIAGALDQMLLDFPNIIERTKAITATSASVGTVSYFLSFGINHPGDKIWVEQLSDPKFSASSAWSAFISGRPIYDVDYLIDTVFHERFPLDIDAIHRSTMLALFPIFNLSSKNIEFFCNRSADDVGHFPQRVLRDFREYDYYDVMRAAKAVPILYDKKVKLGQTNYIDAGQFEPYTLDAPGTRGLKKILIATKYKSSFVDSVKYCVAGTACSAIAKCTNFLEFAPDVYQGIAKKPFVYSRLGQEVDALVKGGELLLVVPNKKLHSHTGNSISELKENYELGREWVIENAKYIDQFSRISHLGSECNCPENDNDEHLHI
jgi:predicted patatin/cPLA2 family phospholipase